MTVAGLAGLLTFHTRATTLAAGSASTGGSSAGRSGASGSGSTASGPASSGSGSGSAGSGSSGSGSSGSGSSSGTAPAAPSGTITVTGATYQYGYGQLDVRVTLSGGRITDVTVPSLQVADPMSQQIATEVFPMLKRQVLSAQSANIQGVTGATYTSEAYARSLQSALSKAKGG